MQGFVPSEDYVVRSLSLFKNVTQFRIENEKQKEEQKEEQKQFIEALKQYMKKYDIKYAPKFIRSIHHILSEPQDNSTKITELKKTMQLYKNNFLSKNKPQHFFSPDTLFNKELTELLKAIYKQDVKTIRKMAGMTAAKPKLEPKK